LLSTDASSIRLTVGARERTAVLATVGAWDSLAVDGGILSLSDVSAVIIGGTCSETSGIVIAAATDDGGGGGGGGENGVSTTTTTESSCVSPMAKANGVAERRRSRGCGKRKAEDTTIEEDKHSNLMVLSFYDYHSYSTLTAPNHEINRQSDSAYHDLYEYDIEKRKMSLYYISSLH
jgi:hypothetical protein